MDTAVEHYFPRPSLGFVLGIGLATLLVAVAVKWRKKGNVEDLSDDSAYTRRMKLADMGVDIDNMTDDDVHKTFFEMKKKKSQSYNASHHDELFIGKAVEREHADTVDAIKSGELVENDDIFERIASDHLDEIPDYYTRLTRMEERAKKDMRGRQRHDAPKFIEAGMGRFKKQAQDIKILMAKAKDLKDLPSPEGWDEYYDSHMKPKMDKVMKGIGVVAGASTALTPTGLPIAVGMLISKKFRNKIKELVAKFGGTKVMEMVNNIAKALVGKTLTVIGIYVEQGKDVKKTLAVLSGASAYSAVQAPNVKFNWSKIDTGKIFNSVLGFADDAVPVMTAAGGVATSETGVGAVAGGAATEVTGVGAFATDVMAVINLFTAVLPAIEIGGKSLPPEQIAEAQKVAEQVAKQPAQTSGA